MTHHGVSQSLHFSETIMWCFGGGGGSMILAPDFGFCTLYTVTYARGATNVGFFMMDRLHGL